MPAALPNAKTPHPAIYRSGACLLSLDYFYSKHVILTLRFGDLVPGIPGKAEIF